MKTKKHTIELLEEMNANITKFLEYNQTRQMEVSISLVERLLKHPETLIYNNSMLQLPEPGFVALNTGGNNSDSHPKLEKIEKSKLTGRN